MKLEKMENFEKWLRSRGCEILPLTNEFEVLRFRSRKGTGVIYSGKRGVSGNGPLAIEAYECFITGSKWRNEGRPTKRYNGSKRKRELLDRDGDECFFCGFPLGSDITNEHLVSIIHKGPDRLENMVLSHKLCNELAGNMALVDKIKLRDSMRGDV